MSAENLDSENQSLKKYVKISMIVHVGIFLALTIKATFFADPPIQFENAIRVDIVGLPDKVLKEPAPAPAPEPAAPEKSKEQAPVEKVVQIKKQKLPDRAKENDPEAINLDKAKKKQKQALEKLKQMEALEAIEKQIESENRKKAAASQVKYKGNVLSSGSELRGIHKLQADTYVGDVHKHMLMNWSLPEYLKKRNLRVVILVRFDESGNILGKNIVKGSGNPTFDDMVLLAIQKSSPVPAPPAKFAKIAADEGFQFIFRHDD